jgi:hypothetical protein
MKKIKNWLLVLLVAVGAAGCTGLHNDVVVVTSTVLGMKVGQNPQTQMYQAELGYARSEVALVPTAPTNKYTPDVLVELKMTGLMSFNAGVYQRLAVGSTACSQIGAAALFSKDANGSLGTNATAAFQAVKVNAVPALPPMPPIPTPPKLP